MIRIDTDEDLIHAVREGLRHDIKKAETPFLTTLNFVNPCSTYLILMRFPFLDSILRPFVYLSGETH